MSDEMITIPYSEYESLKEDAAFLRRLEAAGVDNWEWYHLAFDDEDEDEEDDA